MDMARAYCPSFTCNNGIFTSNETFQKDLRVINKEGGRKLQKIVMNKWRDEVEHQKTFTQLTFAEINK